MQIVDLKTQNLFNPIGIQTEKPVLSWRLISEGAGQKQTAYRIVAATAKEKLERGLILIQGKVMCGIRFTIALMTSRII